ncbi:LPS translocon maturation chaperone LptM [Microbulbifer hainanensis]|uniref:LPS translocon maturation chaperone LptM n=1 Tax=Microbulbifer hainanensis TaxID=2735675 RepID=UPI001D012C99|nr:lipoprotein [Microbulbifer hainanensis]
MSKKLFLSLTVILSACGQKGPLYLPQEPAAPAPVQSPVTAAPVATTPVAAGSTATEKSESERKAAGEDAATAPEDNSAEPEFEK